MCFLIQDGVEKYGHRVHAFCFMNNHIHLLIQIGEVSLSKIMQNLAFRYSQKINRKNKRAGHLFQGRFKAILIDEALYFKRLLRYIHMNPVRAGIAIAPEQYVWSSHNAYLGTNEISWLTFSHGLSKFSKILEEAKFLYATFILKKEREEELEELRKGFRDGQVLGDDDFLDKVRESNSITKNHNLSLRTILNAVCQVFEISEKEIISTGKSQKASLARGTISMIANEMGKISIEEIAFLMSRDGSTISSLNSRFHRKHQHSLEIQNLVNKAKTKATQIAELQA